VKCAPVSGAADQKVSLSFVVLDGEDYLQGMSIPNVYFHVAMIYAILHQGESPNLAADFDEAGRLGVRIWLLQIRVPRA
jgi:hypothetical protein